MDDLSFVRGWVLGGLVLAPVVFALWVVCMRRAHASARRITREPGRGPAYLAAALFASAAAVAIVAAAGPRWGSSEQQVSRTGSDLVVVLDVSRSMDAGDVAPSRLAASRESITATLDQLTGDRAGLVIFAGSARIRFPLTTDMQAAARVVATIESGTVLVEGGSSAAAGLDLAVEAFGESEGAGRVVLLISDGENLAGTEGLAEAAQRLAAAGAHLLVVGVGTADGGTIPVFDRDEAGFVPKLDANSEPIITRLDETTLELLASAAGGQYLGSDLSVVPGAVAGRLASLEQVQFQEASTEVPIERFQPFAAAALILLCLGAIAERLPALARRRSVAIGALATGLLLVACATAAHSANEDGRDAFAAGDFGGAIDYFLAARAEEPDNPTLALNLASAHHAAGEYEEAARVARSLLSSTDQGVQADGYASLGHHLFAQGDLPGALEAFHQSLRRDPLDDDVRHDYEVVLALLSQETPTPEPGEQPTPAPGDPGTPEPGATPTAPGEPGPGDPGTPDPSATPGSGPGQPTEQDIDAQLAAIDAEIARLIEEAGPEPTTAEALEILDLIAERARIASQRDGIAGGGGDPDDY